MHVKVCNPVSNPVRTLVRTFLNGLIKTVPITRLKCCLLVTPKPAANCGPVCVYLETEGNSTSFFFGVL